MSGRRIAAVTVLCLGLTLIAAEVLLRRGATYVVKRTLDDAHGSIEADPEFLVVTTARGRRLVPNSHVTIKNHYLSHRDVEIDTNSLGFRGPDIPPERAPTDQRIMILGDSITLSDFLPQNETFVDRVERILRAQSPGRSITVINAGVNNTGTEEQVNLLDDTIAQVKPTALVLAFYLNDSRPPWGFSGEVGDRGWLRRHSLLWETIYTHWKQRRFIEEIGRPQFKWIAEMDRLDWKHDPAQFSRLVQAAEFDWGAAWIDDSWTRLAPQFDRLRAIAEREHLALLVLGFPVLFQVEAVTLDDYPQRGLQREVHARGFSYVDLLPLFRAHAAEDLFFDQCHLTSHGSELAAPVIAAAIEGILPSAAEGT